MSRAASSLESNPYYKSDDHLAVLLLPTFLKLLLKIPLVSSLFGKVVAPRGTYEYVIARTKYIDEIFQQVLAEQFDQILLFGAGFDTRAIRFNSVSQDTIFFELEITATQTAKIQQYQKRKLAIPSNVVFVPIDFEKDSVSQKLDEAGFRKGARSLFILEGLLMYLHRESVDKMFRIIKEYAGKGSRVVFDYIYASVLRRENLYYGEQDIVQSVAKINEQWHFGIEKGEIEQFLLLYGFRLRDHRDAKALEDAYFKTPDGKIVGRVNGTHCLVTAEIV